MFSMNWVSEVKLGQDAHPALPHGRPLHAARTARTARPGSLWTSPLSKLRWLTTSSSLIRTSLPVPPPLSSRLRSSRDQISKSKTVKLTRKHFEFFLHQWTTYKAQANLTVNTKSSTSRAVLVRRSHSSSSADLARMRDLLWRGKTREHDPGHLQQRRPQTHLQA